VPTNPETGEPTEAEIRQWRRRFFGLLVFGAIFLVVSTLVFLKALSSDQTPVRTADQIRLLGQEKGRILFENLERRNSHFPDRETFLSVMTENQSDYPGIPDDLYPLFIESTWTAYTRAKEDFYRVDF